MDSQLGHAIPIGFDIDGLGALSPELDFRHVLNEQQFTAQHLGDFFEFRCRVVIAVNSQEDTPHIAVVVVDHRGSRPRRQLRLNVADLAAQLVPDLWQRRLVVLVLDPHGDRREPAV